MKWFDFRVTCSHKIINSRRCVYLYRNWQPYARSNLLMNLPKINFGRSDKIPTANRLPNVRPSDLLAVLLPNSRVKKINFTLIQNDYSNMCCCTRRGQSCIVDTLKHRAVRTIHKWKVSMKETKRWTADNVLSQPTVIVAVDWMSVPFLCLQDGNSLVHHLIAWKILEKNIGKPAMSRGSGWRDETRAVFCELKPYSAPVKLTLNTL